MVQIAKGGLNRPGLCGVKRTSGTVLDEPAVVTLTVIAITDDPLGVAGFGVIVQLAYSGAPVHMKLTCELNPLVGVRFKL